MSQLTAIGEASIDKWGAYGIGEYAKQLIPVHGVDGHFPFSSVPIIGRCRCRIIAGQWVYEPDACPYCKSLGNEWNSVVTMPTTVDAS